MKFEARIDGVHIDPKKGTIKISVAVASHISLDELTTIGPKDESIWITLESEQTRIEVVPRTLNGTAIEPGSREERELEEGRIITEFPTPAADEDVKPTGDAIVLAEKEAAKRKEAAERLKEEFEEGDEVDGGGQGGIV